MYVFICHDYLPVFRCNGVKQPHLSPQATALAISTLTITLLYLANISANADANAGAGDYPGRLVLSTTADGASSPTERMRISSAGDVFLRQAGGAERVYFTSAGSASIGPSAYAASSTTLYIGNAAIQVSPSILCLAEPFC
jgi:hypothetical protein